MSLPPVLHALLSTPGPSGYESAPAEVWRAAAAPFSTVAQDHMGSSTATVKGTAGGPTLALIGHIDEIGLIVTHVDDSGFLRFTQLGGWDPMILIGQRVEVHTRDGVLPGVVGKKPIHLMSADDRKKGADMKELHIDVGAQDGDEARSLVRTGDWAVISGAPVELLNGRAYGRSMDNRLGAYVALEAARLVAEAGGAPGDVVAMAPVQEENGLNGSRAAAFTLKPDAAIVIDVTHATDAPGVDVNQLGKHDLGSGPVLERGAILNPRLFDLLHDTAEAEAIAFTIAASGNRTGTDADVVNFAHGGIPTTCLSIPLRYMHSPVEVVQLSDVEDGARLIAAAAQRLVSGFSFLR